MNDDWTGATRAPARGDAGNALRSHVTWSAGDLVAGIVATLVLIFLLGLVVQVAVAGPHGDEAPESYFASFVATIIWDLGFVAIVVFLLAKKGAGLRNLGFRLPRTPFSTTVAWVVGGYFMLYGSVAIYNIIVSLLGLDFLEPSQQLPENVFDNTWVIAIAGVAIVMAAPFAEEVFFRGFLFAGLLRYLPLWPSALLSGAIFSLAHANPGLIIPFSLVGAILAWLYSKTNSLITPMAVHLLFNLTSYSILVFVPEAR